MAKGHAVQHAIEPACDTKHLKHLSIPLKLAVDRDVLINLEQDDAAGATTGTTLWLGAQVDSMISPSSVSH